MSVLPWSHTSHLLVIILKIIYSGNVGTGQNAKERRTHTIFFGHIAQHALAALSSVSCAADKNNSK